MFWIQSSCVHSYSEPPICPEPCSPCWKNGEPGSNSCLRSLCTAVIWCVLVSLYRVETWPASFRLSLASGPSPCPSTVRISDSQPASASPGWPSLSPVLKSQLIQLWEHKALCPGNRTKPIQASQSRVHDILETKDPVKTASRPNHPGNSSHWEIAVKKLKARRLALKRGGEGAATPALPLTSSRPLP